MKLKAKIPFFIVAKLKINNSFDLTCLCTLFSQNKMTRNENRLWFVFENKAKKT